MKFAIVVLLGLCAFAAAQDSSEEYAAVSPLRSEIFDSVYEKLSEVIKKATHELDVIVNKVKEIADTVQGQLVSFGRQTKAKLGVLKNEAVNKIQELILKGGEFKECAQKLIPKYEQVEKEARSDFHTCTSDVVAEYKKFSKLIGHDVEEVKAVVETVTEEIKVCLSSNIIAFIKCAKPKSDDFESFFKTFKTSVDDAVVVARHGAEKIVSDVKVCNSALLEKASSQVSTLNQKLAQCYKN